MVAAAFRLPRPAMLEATDSLPGRGPMPPSTPIVARATLLALLVLAPRDGLAVAQAQPIGVIAQAVDEEEDADAAPPRRRGVVSEEPETAEEAAEQHLLPRQGASRRLDPFDVDDVPARGKPASSSLA